MHFPICILPKNGNSGLPHRKWKKLFSRTGDYRQQGYKSVDYGRLTPVLVEAIKEQQAMIDILIREVNELKRNRPVT